MNVNISSCISMLLLTASLLSFSQTPTTPPNIFEKGANQVKMFDAHQDFLRGDIDQALGTYTNILKETPNDGPVTFHVGECYFAKGEYDHAIEFLEKAQKLDAKSGEDLYLLLGKSYHRIGDLNNALKAFDVYKKSLNNDQKKISDSEVDNNIAQCKMAQSLMETPVDVTVTNLGTSINSAEDDKNPSVTADGKTLIFSSRRPTKGLKSAVDLESDRKYFEHIYMVTWDDSKGVWNNAQPIPGNITVEEEHEACASISPDGKKVFVYKNNKTNARGGDLFVSKINSTGKWSKPESLGKPINTSYYEDGACLSPDGHLLYFISENPKGGQGQADIWVSKKVTNTEWSEPVNLGPEVNTPGDEVGIFIAPDGKNLFFSSNGHKGMGGFDIFRTTLENGKWSKPVNLGYPINSVNNDIKFTLSADAKFAYLASDRKGGIGERDIYKVDLKEYAVLEKDFKRGSDVLAILKGDVFGSQAGEALRAEINIYDEQGNKVASTSCGDQGDYFITLLGAKKYEARVELKGYKTVSEKFELKADKQNTFTLVKHFILTKE